MALHYIYKKKIKDTFYGEKNITLLSNLVQIKRKNSIMELANNSSSVLFIPALGTIKGPSPGTQRRVILNINKIRSFHTKVKASKRIGPHNEEILSILVGSILGDCSGNRRSV